jgi:ActR/RegA family two-component response regulator
MGLPQKFGRPFFFSKSGCAKKGKLEILNAKHVLIVEDNLHLRRILGRAFEQRGYTVSAEATGEEAFISHQRKT